MPAFGSTCSCSSAKASNGSRRYSQWMCLESSVTSDDCRRTRLIGHISHAFAIVFFLPFVLLVILQTAFKSAVFGPTEEVIEVFNVLEGHRVGSGDTRPGYLALHEPCLDHDCLARMAEREDDPGFALAQIVTPELHFSKEVVVETPRLLTCDLSANFLRGRKGNPVQGDSEFRPDA